jgi:cytidylate kinase
LKFAGWQYRPMCAILYLPSRHFHHTFSLCPTPFIVVAFQLLGLPAGFGRTGNHNKGGDVMKSIERIIEEQVQRWQLLSREQKGPKEPEPVITISREPGSGGALVAEQVAQNCGYDLYHKQVLDAIANNANIKRRLLETLDERGLTVIDEYISSLVHQQHLWPDAYLKQLMKAIGAIGVHGRAVILGRGAHFVLPPENRIRVRLIASREFRAGQVARTYGVSESEALSRIIRTESGRKSFIRKYFNADASDPLNYDMILNTGTLGIDKAVKTICALIQ